MAPPLTGVWLHIAQLVAQAKATQAKTGKPAFPSPARGVTGGVSAAKPAPARGVAGGYRPPPPPRPASPPRPAPIVGKVYAPGRSFGPVAGKVQVPVVPAKAPKAAVAIPTRPPLVRVPVTPQARLRMIRAATPKPPAMPKAPKGMPLRVVTPNGPGLLPTTSRYDPSSGSWISDAAVTRMLNLGLSASKATGKTMIALPPPVRVLPRGTQSTPAIWNPYQSRYLNSKEMDQARSQMLATGRNPVIGGRTLPVPRNVYNYWTTPKPGGGIGGDIRSATNWLAQAGMTGGNWLGTAAANAVGTTGAEAAKIAQTLTPSFGKGPGGGAGKGPPIATGITPAAAILEGRKLVQSGVRQIVSSTAEAVPSAYFVGQAARQAVEGDPTQLDSILKQQWDALTTAKGWEQNWANNILLLRGLWDAGTAGALRFRRVVSAMPAAQREMVGGIFRGGPIGKLVELPPAGGERSPLVIKQGTEIPRQSWALGRAKRRAQMLRGAPWYRKALRFGPVRDNPMVNAKGEATGVYHQVVKHLNDFMVGRDHTDLRHGRQAIQAEALNRITDTRSSARWQAAKRHALNPLEPLLHPIMNGADLQSLIAQGAIRANRGRAILEADIRKVRDIFAKEQHKPGSVEEQIQAHNVNVLEGLLHNDQFLDHPMDVLNAARQQARAMNPMKDEMVDRGLLNGAAGDRAPLQPFQYVQQDARMGLTPEGRLYERANADYQQARQEWLQARNSLWRGVHGGPRVRVESSSNIKGLRIVAENAQAKMAKALEYRNGLEKQGFKGQEGMIHPDSYPDLVVHKGRAGQPHERAGEVVTNEETHAAMRGEGIDPADVTHVSHRAMTDEQAAYGSMTRLPLAATKRRTMASFAGGLIDISHNALVNQHMAMWQKIARTDHIVSFIREFGLPASPTNAAFRLLKQARDAANSNEFKDAHGIPHNVELTVMRGPPEYATHMQAAALNRQILQNRNLADVGQHEEDLLPNEADATPLTAAEAATHGAGDQAAGPWVVVIKSALDNELQHERATGYNFIRGVGDISSRFRMAVLPWSPRAVVGAPIETGIRALPAVGGNPLGLARGWRYAGNVARESRFEKRGRVTVPVRVRKAPVAGYGVRGTLENMSIDDASSPKAQKLAKQALRGIQADIGVGNYGGQALRDVYHVPDKRYQGPIVDKSRAASELIRRLPGPGHLVKYFTASSKNVLAATRRFWEIQGNRAVYGHRMLQTAQEQFPEKTMRDQMRAMTPAITDLLEHGKMNTPAQHAAMAEMERAMGKYANQGPLMRGILNFAPFLSWTLNSYKFLFAVLPSDHPLLTGLLAAANTATAQQRAAAGFGGPGQRGEVPGYEESGLPLPGNKVATTFGYYGPSSAVGDFPSSFTSQVLPWAQPAILAAGGVDYTFRVPKNAQGKRVPLSLWDRVVLGFTSTVNAAVPGAEPITRLIQNPGSFLNPFGIRAAYPAITPKKPGGSSGFSTGSGFSSGFSKGSGFGG